MSEKVMKFFIFFLRICTQINHILGLETNQDEEKGGSDWVSSAEQSDGVLVHGGLGET